ncbi:MAG: cysteine desulfurase NifS [Candidatus Aenigmatarchaeota archaeon]|nr:MAG: cysteine desulfurase NifS [Candidatus Aenigmarchaeota archaeon]
MRRIYMDHAATTPVDAEVLKAMRPYFSEKFGNASSLHGFGQEARKALENSRITISGVIGAQPDEMVFTSGGTESDNLAIRGVAMSKGRGHIITSRIEHHAVLHTCQQLEKAGFGVTYLPVDRNGFVSPLDVENAIRKDTILATIMHANNEIGTIEPIGEIGRICRDNGVLFHTDAVQSFGKVPIDVNKMNIDMLSASAHKLYGPKGVGALYVRSGIDIVPQNTGGGHEKGKRSGTENVAGIVGFAKAALLAAEHMEKRASHEKRLRGMLIKGLKEIPNTWLNGHPEKRLPNNVNVCFSGIEGESLIIHMDMKGIAASTGSACSSKSLEPSHVLVAIGLKHKDAHGSLRLSLGKENTMDDVRYVTEAVPGIVENLRKISPFGRS